MTEETKKIETVEEFVEQVKKLGLKWGLQNKWGYPNQRTVRCAVGDCPIVAMARVVLKEEDPWYNNCNAAELAAKMGIHPELAYDIMDAADSKYAQHRGAIMRLLKEQ